MVEIVACVSTWIWDGVKWLWNVVSTTLSIVGQSILVALAAVGKGIVDFIRWIPSALEATGTWIVNGIVTVLAGIGKGVIDLFTFIGNTGIWILAGIGKVVWDSATWGIDRVGDLIEWSTSKITKGILDGVMQTGTMFDGALAPIPGSIGGLGDIFTGIEKRTAPGDVSLSIQDVIAQYQSQYQDLYTAHSPRTPEQASIDAAGWETSANAAYLVLNSIFLFIETISLGQIDVSLASYLNTPVFAVWLQTAKSIAAARDEASLLIPLKQHYLREFTPMIPDYNDMIGTYVKEGYLSEKWVEIPAEFVDYMKLLGYPEFWTQRLWGKHWVLPGLSDLYDMLHRRIIGSEELRSMLKYHDYEPKWREKLEKISYRVWRLTDLRRGWETGILDDDQLRERLLDYGYDPDQVDNIAATNKAMALETEIGKVRDEILKDLEAGWIDETQARSNLAAIGTAPRLIDYYVDKTIFRLERADLEDRVTSLRQLFRQKRIDTPQLRAGLIGLGMQVWRVEDVIEVEESKLKLPPTSTDLETYTQIAEAKLEALYTDAVIDEPRLRAGLKDLGYKNEDAELLVTGVKRKIEAAKAKAA